MRSFTHINARTIEEAHLILNKHKGKAVINAGGTRATAQVFGGGADYLLATGQISTASEALYVVDLARQRLMAFQYDRTTRRMTPITGRRLQDDFRQASGPTGGRP